MHAIEHHSEASMPRILRLSLLATLAYIVLLVVSGLKAKSLALLSEAGHNVSDFLALLLSLAAVYIQARPPSKRKTFGYHRAGVVAAFINASALVLVAFYIIYEAFERLRNPEPVQGMLMIYVAAAGVVLNGLISLFLYRSSRSDLNVRSVFLHEVGDTLSTFAVIIGGFAIKWTGQTWIDPALSVGIAALIVWSSFGIIRETLNILLEGTPTGIELEHIAEAIEDVEGVNDVHDLHVWTIGSGVHALSCHIAIPDIPPSQSERIIREVNQALASKFNIQHTTIQFEHAVCEVAHGCVVPTGNHHGHHH